MSRYCMIEVAFDKKEEVEETILTLLDKNLACSCQVIQSDSYWNWKGNRESSKEYLMFIKSKKSLVKEIYQMILKIHSYNCFEFAVFDLDSCSKEYIKWIDEETKGK